MIKVQEKKQDKLRVMCGCAGTLSCAISVIKVIIEGHLLARAVVRRSASPGSRWWSRIRCPLMHLVPARAGRGVGAQDGRRARA